MNGLVASYPLNWLNDVADGGRQTLKPLFCPTVELVCPFGVEDGGLKLLCPLLPVEGLFADARSA